MTINSEIKSTIPNVLHSAMKRWFDLSGSNEYLSSKQYGEIIKAFDVVQGILSLMDENIHYNYESSNELDQIVNISKLLCSFMGDNSHIKPDFTGYMINTLTQYQTTRTFIEAIAASNKAV